MTSPSSDAAWSGRLWAVAMAALFLVAALFAASLVGWDALGDALAMVTWGDLAVLLALSLANYGLRAVRWRLFAQALSIPTSPVQDVAQFIGGFALAATPGKVGELVRLYWISAATGLGVARTGAIVVADRAGDLAAIAILIAATAAAASGHAALALVAAALALALATALSRADALRWGVTRAWRIVGRWPRLFGRLRRAAGGMAALTRPGVALLALALGLAGWAAEGVALWWLLSAMGVEIGPAAAIFIFSFSMLAGAVSALPGGIGGTEAAMTALLTLAGAPLGAALAATAIIRATTLWFAVALGALVFPIAARVSRMEGAA